MLISIVLNVDTREGFTNLESKAEHMFDGCKSIDFLIDATVNKIQFFKGFDIEVILYIDEHVKVPTELMDALKAVSSTLVIRRHTLENSFNDYNYLRALSMASGDIIAHFDQDTAAFTSSPEPVHELIKYLDDYKFVSYPSHWSPKPVIDESFGNRTWASTRFFMCKRETLNFDVLRKCLEEPEWAYQQFGDSPRRCNWLEHFLTLTNNDSCFYPPMDLDRYAIFSWGSYRSGILSMLQPNKYEDIKNWILKCGGVVYPNDVHVQ